MAVRKKERTTMMRVNDVIMIRIDGARERMVNIATSWITRPVTVPLPSAPMSKDNTCANASLLKATMHSATKLKRLSARLSLMKFLSLFFEGDGFILVLRRD